MAEVDFTFGKGRPKQIGNIKDISDRHRSSVAGGNIDWNRRWAAHERNPGGRRFGGGIKRDDRRLLYRTNGV